MKFIKLTTARGGIPIALNIELIGFIHEVAVNEKTYGEIYVQGHENILRVQEDLKTILDLIESVSDNFEMNPGI